MYKKQWLADGLVPVYSKCLTVEKGCKSGKLNKRQKWGRGENKFMFVECTRFDDLKDEHIDDVILMDKVIYLLSQSVHSTTYYYD